MALKNSILRTFKRNIIKKKIEKRDKNLYNSTIKNNKLTLHILNKYETSNKNQIRFSFLESNELKMLINLDEMCPKLLKRLGYTNELYIIDTKNQRDDNLSEYAGLFKLLVEITPNYENLIVPQDFYDSANYGDLIKTYGENSPLENIIKNFSENSEIFVLQSYKITKKQDTSYIEGDKSTSLSYI